MESEERGIAEAIALNLREMAALARPIIVVVTGEGGSGGALGLRRGRPRADAGVRGLQRDPAGRLRGDPVARRRAARSKRPRRCRSRRPICCERAIIDEIVPEPLGGAHHEPDAAARCSTRRSTDALAEVSTWSDDERMQRRYDKLRTMGRLGIEFVDVETGAASAHT